MKKIINTVLLMFLDLLFLSIIYYLISHLFRVNISINVWIIVLILLMFFYEKIYCFRYDFWQEIKKIYKSLCFSLILVLILNIFFKKEINLNFIFLYFLLLCLVFPIYKRIIKKFLFKFPFFKKKVKIIDNSDILSQEIKKNWYLGMEESNINYEIILINSKNLKVDNLNELIENFIHKKEIYLIPYINEIDFSNSQIFEYYNIRKSVINIENKLLKFQNILFKNFIDIILLIFIFPFFIFIHIIVSVLIKIDSKGNVFFKQKRVGKNGKIFTCYKYRTMYENGDKLLEEYLSKHPEEIEFYKKYHKYKNDPRITRIGKLLRISSIDELPQIINVLKGEMSFIGPRPYMIEEVEENIEDFNLILKVKPGITGLWQVSGRNNLTFEERINLDRWYIKNWSLWYDFVIFIKTIKIVILRIGAK